MIAVHARNTVNMPIANHQIALDGDSSGGMNRNTIAATRGKTPTPIHGLRRPQRVRVRSESVPITGSLMASNSLIARSTTPTSVISAPTTSV